jgi:hypothetical protein
VGTHLEPGKNEKKNPSPGPRNLKGTKQGTLSACLGVPIGSMKFFSSQKNLLPFLAWANTPCKEHNTHYKLGVLIYSVSY